MESEINVQDMELKSLIGFDGNPVNGMIVHPDGVHLVYPLGTNVTSYNWNTRGQRFFVGHTNVISAVAVSRSGRYVGAGQVNYMGFRSRIIVWDFETGNAVAKYDAHKVRVESVAFSFCETYALSLGGLDDGAVMVYDIGRQQVLCAASSVKPTAGAAAVIRPSRLRGECFVVAGDNLLRLWTLNREQRNVRGLDATLHKIKRNILCVEIDRADEHAYCGTGTGDLLKIKLNARPSDGADAEGAGGPCSPPAPSLVGCFAKYAAKTRGGAVELYAKGVTSLHLFDDDDDAAAAGGRATTIVVGTGDGVVELVEQKPQPQVGQKSAKPTTVRVRQSQKPPVVATSSGRRPCAVAATRFAAALTAPTRPLLVARKSTNVESAVTSIQAMKKKDVILAGTMNCEVFTIAADTFQTTRVFTCHTSVVYDLAFPHDYSKVFATASRNDVRVWSVDTLHELLRITVRNAVCSGVLFSRDGTQIVTSWNDGKIRTFTPQSGRLLYAIENCHNNGVTAIAMTEDGRRLLSGGGDGQMRVWGLQLQPSDQLQNGGGGGGGSLLAVLKEHKGPVSSIDVHRLGQQAVTASADGTCVVWDIVRYTRLSIMFAATVFTEARFHPNGVQLLTCGTNRCIGLWEAIDGSLIREIEGSSASAINSLDVTPSGKYIVTGSSDQMVKVWLYKEGVPTHVGAGHASVVTNVRVSPDGQLVVSTSVDGGIYLWRFPHVDGVAPAPKCIPPSAAHDSLERQTDSCRRLSQQRTAALTREENIGNISKAQNVQSVTDGAPAGSGDSGVATNGGPRTSTGGGPSTANGSVKCLCRRGTTCTCGDGDGNVLRKCSTSSSHAR